MKYIDPIRDGSNWFVYCNNEPVNFRDAWGLEATDEKSLIEEFLEIFDLKVGAQVTVGVNIPNVISAEVSLDLLSINYEDGENSFQQGVNLELKIGSDALPVTSTTLSSKKKIIQNGSQTPFDLYQLESTTSIETEINTDYTMSILAAPGVTVEVNATEGADFIVKTGKKVMSKIKDFFGDK